MDLVYPQGEKCANGQARELRLHFICAHNHDSDDAPRFVSEAAGDNRCHYNVTWPSRHACPVSSSTSFLLGLARFGGVLYSIYFVVSTVYLMLGCIINAWVGRGEIGWSSMPQREYWEHLARTHTPVWLKKLLRQRHVAKLLAVCMAVCSAICSVLQAVLVFVRRWTYKLLRLLRVKGQLPGEEQEQGQQQQQQQQGQGGTSGGYSSLSRKAQEEEEAEEDDDAAAASSQYSDLAFDKYPMQAEGRLQGGVGSANTVVITAGTASAAAVNSRVGGARRQRLEAAAKAAGNKGGAAAAGTAAPSLSSDGAAGHPGPLNSRGSVDDGGDEGLPGFGQKLAGDGSLLEDV